MDRLIAPGTVPPGQGDQAPSVGTPGLATDGDLATGKPQTIFPAYAWNMLSEEVRNVVLDGPLTPNTTIWTQLRDAIRAMIARAIAGIPKPASQRLVFLYSGSWTVPDAVTQVRFRLVGAGGAGGGCLAGTRSGGGGGAGGYAEGLAAVTPGNIVAIGVGVGGTPVTNTAGNPGSGSTFGGWGTATGGAGGASGSPDSFGGAPGVASVAAGVQGIGLVGGYGGDGSPTASTIIGGTGGASAFGGGGRGGAGGGQAGIAPGSGGGGAYSTTSLGGGGAGGMVIVEWTS